MCKIIFMIIPSTNQKSACESEVSFCSLRVLLLIFVHNIYGSLLQLKSLLRTADVAEDFTMDRALHEACQPVADVACKSIKPGSSK